MKRVLIMLTVIPVIAVGGFLVVRHGPWRHAGQIPMPTAAGSAAMSSLSEPAIAAMRDVFPSYHQVHDLLAADAVTGVGAAGTALAEQVRVAVAALPADSPLRRAMMEVSDHALHLAKDSTLKDARADFSEISHALVDLGGSDPRVRQGLIVFRCPMAPGFQKWVQTSPSIANPYMGKAMSTCGSESTWSEAATPAVLGESAGEVAFYTCSMHPSVKQSGPGRCPICSMDLVPVTKQQVATGEITVDQQRRQILGIRTEAISERPMALTIRTAGRVMSDESAVTDVSLKIGGWVTEVVASRTGAPVKAGEPLFSLYSPEIYAAEQELVLATKHAPKEGQATGTLLSAVRERLSLWGLGDDQLDAIVASGVAPRNVVIRAPASGIILEKEIVTGGAVQPGQKLYRIADLGHVWVMADLYEGDLGAVKPGQPAVITMTFAPGAPFTGAVDFVYPYLRAETRTAKARIVLENRDQTLRPDMYATVSMTVDLGEKLQVPKSAVLYTGTRRLVFVDLGDGRLKPQPVTLGRASEDAYEVIGGLKAGDVVVASGNFLIAAESRIRSAEQYWGGDDAAK